MTFVKSGMIVVAALALAGCEAANSDKSIDRGIDSKPLSLLATGIWVDPNGCDHWIIDDGVEGYLSARLDRYGKPVCSGVGAPTQTRGDFKQGGTSAIGDPI